MADPIRLQIMDALAPLFTPTAMLAPATYDFDAAPLVGIVDQDEAAEPTMDNYKLPMRVRCVAVDKYDAANNPRHRVGNLWLAKLRTVMESADLAMVEHIEYVQGGVIYLDDDSPVVSAFADFDVIYYTDRADPETYTF